MGCETQLNKINIYFVANKLQADKMLFLVFGEVYRVGGEGSPFG